MKIGRPQIVSRDFDLPSNYYFTEMNQKNIYKTRFEDNVNHIKSTHLRNGFEQIHYYFVF